MKYQKLTHLMIGAVAFAVAAVAGAQELQSVQESKDWTVFQDKNNAKYCYVISSPSVMRATRDGKEVQADRGDVYLYIGIKNGATEPAYRAGYPLASDRAVNLNINGTDYKYYTNPSADPQFAWPQPSTDNTIINAMKAGVDLEVTAQSQRGTTTIDKFSLSGFTAAYDAARELCK